MVQRLFNVGQETLLVPENDICTNTATMEAQANVMVMFMEFQDKI